MARLLIATLLLFSLATRADEGMWLPSLIGQTRIADMQAKGLKITAADIYSVNEASLKDAIVLFGGGCTGELISDKGLLLTNHHCGYSQIQAHSSVEHDYLTDGFWAMKKSEELPNKDLSVSFLVRMEDVTADVLAGTTNAMSEAERSEIVAKNSKEIVKKYTDGTDFKADVESFYYGNQYFVFVYEIFRDVRLVGAPPSSIGKFGGDTDNWMWPRHTGDFSIFRIYADKNNRPATYSPDNVPYKPKKSFTISAKGADDGEFTFVYGFPGSTKQFLHSAAVRFIAEKSNPMRVGLRTKRLEIMNEEQAKNIATRIQYASKNASVSNSWKKWQGETKGLNRLGTVAKKQALEERFERWAEQNPTYQWVLPEFERLYAELEPYAIIKDYYTETFGAVELFKFADKIDASIADSVAITAVAEDFFKDYSPTIDLRTAKAMMRKFVANVPTEYQSEIVAEKLRKYTDTDTWMDSTFHNSAFLSAEKLTPILASGDRAAKLAEDPALLLSKAFKWAYKSTVSGKYASLNAEIDNVYRTYIQGLMSMDSTKTFYPDANLTLRVAYGKIDGYKPVDGVQYLSRTTLDGIMEKDNPAIYDYDVPQRLRELHKAKDYGRWAVEGTVPVAFVASNHTTGGNSGSPVLNARGELIGINFDRAWEGVMSDIEYDPMICRNISVDIRYILFVMDKVAGAGYLIDEMKFAK